MASDKFKNPWAIQSIYELQYFNCPTCDYKIHAKQDFVQHAYTTHPESVTHLKNLSDFSLGDITVPWNDNCQPQGMNTQCGNFRIFPSLRFYVKSILGILEVQKLQFLPF